MTVIDGRARSLQGERGSERPNCVGDWKPDDQTLDRWLDITGFEAAALGTFGNCEVGVARAPGYKNVDLVVSKRFAVRRTCATASSGSRRSTCSTSRASGRRRATSAVPNTFGRITSTISAPRVVELVFKIYF